MPFEFAAIKNYQVDDPVTTTIVVADGFTNSDPADCPIEYTIVKNDKNPLDGGLENAFSIVNGKI